MPVLIDLGNNFVDHFPVFETDGVTKKSGESSFVVTVWRDGVVDSVTTAIAEIGSSGEYALTVTPDAVGEWSVEVAPAYNDDLWRADFTVKKAVINMTFSAADDATTARFAVWADRFGERITDLDSVAVVIYSSDGTVVVDMGTDTNDTSDGVFEFSTASANIPSGLEYYLGVTATRGTVSWYSNLGFAKV